MRLYLSEAIANSFLSISKSAGEPIDPMKTQKLVYFAHGYHLGFQEGALSAENVQAWRWGPVFPELYHAVKVYGSGPIMNPLQAVEFDGASMQWTTPKIPEEGDFTNRLIRRIWDVYGGMTGVALSQLTHEEGSPWDKIHKQYPDDRDIVIPNSLIREDFERKIEHARQSRTDRGQ